jgi:hypothetical protein
MRRFSGGNGSVVATDDMLRAFGYGNNEKDNAAARDRVPVTIGGATAQSRRRQHAQVSAPRF